MNDLERLQAHIRELEEIIRQFLRNGLGNCTCDPNATYGPEYSGNFLISARKAIKRSTKS